MAENVKIVSPREIFFSLENIFLAEKNYKMVNALLFTAFFWLM